MDGELEKRIAYFIDPGVTVPHLISDLVVNPLSDGIYRVWIPKRLRIE